MGGERRAVSYDALRAFAARCQVAPARLSTAADTSAHEPALVVLHLRRSSGEEFALSVRELPFAEGGLGFRLFPSALWLSALLVERWELLSAQYARVRALELGAGLAAVGLAAARCGNAAVTLSDFNSGLLRACCAAAAENGVSEVVSVAFCDWAEEADTPPPSSDAHANPEFFRVRAQEAAEPQPWSARIPPDSQFELVLATEVLYEAFAARCLPPLIARRLARPGGRFMTLMAVRDLAILRAFVAGLCAQPGLRVAVCSVARLPLPGAPPPERPADLPFCDGLGWMSAAECDAAVMDGGEGGGAWVEALAEGPAVAPAGPCCSRRARGFACPCAASRK